MSRTANEARAHRRAVAVVTAADRIFGVSRRYRPADGAASSLVEAFADEAREAHRAGGPARLVAVTAAAIAGFAVDALRHGWRRPGRKRRPRAARSKRGDSTMQTLLQDVRLALRGFRRQPGFAAAVVFTLALGIAANSTIFALVDAILLRPLPYPEPDRLVRVVSLWNSDLDSAGGAVNPLDVADWERGAPAFASLGAWSRTSQAITGAGDPTMVGVGLATPSFFRALGTRAAAGHLFGAEHEATGHENEIVLSDGLWRRRFGADPEILGRPVTVAGTACVVIGILPRDFASPGASQENEPEIWRPYRADPADGRGGHFMRAVGRLRPGATLEQARAELAEISRRLERENPGTNHGLVAVPEPLARSIAAEGRPALLMLAAAVAVVLLIACANVAHLLLARAAGRERELAVRGALGAGRWRLARHLLTESLVFSAVAGVIGVLGAWLALRALPSQLVAALPTVLAVRLDLRVVGFTVALSAATAALFGVAPALAGARADLRGALVSGTRSSAGGGRAQRALLVAETALALVLLISATLLLESFARLQRVDPGFDAAKVLTFRITLPRTRYAASADRTAFFAELERRLAALPGVDAAGSVNMAPLTDRMSCDSFGLGDRPAPPEGEEPCAESRSASATYFAAMAIPPLAGRGLEPGDGEDAAPVVVVSETMAKKYWPAGDAVGQRFKWGSVSADGPWRTIVGVVSDIKFFGLDAAAAPEVYSPIAQVTPSSVTVAVRTRRDPATLVGEARAAVATLDPELPIFEVRTTRELLERSTFLRRLRTDVLSAFAAVALLLAMIGIHGVMSFYVARRRREIGIKMSLGASPRSVLWEVVRSGMSGVLAGTALGLVGALGAARLLGGLLYGVGATDPTAFVAAPVALLATALVANLLPARRATRVDPLEAIRAE